MELANVNIYIEILSALLVVMFTVFSKKRTKMLATQYDLENVTPGDYSLYI